MITKIRPQLARPYEKERDEAIIESDDWLAEEKLDGHRCLIIGRDAFSRTWKPKKLDFVHTSDEPGDLILDGEIIVREGCGEKGHAMVSHWLANDQSKLVLICWRDDKEPTDCVFDFEKGISL